MRPIPLDFDSDNIVVPWVTLWSEEDRPEVRPCRFANGFPALWMPHRPGVGTPVFKRKHPVRQRRAAALGLCETCGKPIADNDRWLFTHALTPGSRNGGRLVSELPACGACAERAPRLCPFLRRQGYRPVKLPAGVKFQVGFNHLTAQALRDAGLGERGVVLGQPHMLVPDELAVPLLARARAKT
jgi:hypothetical protein